MTASTSSSSFIRSRRSTRPAWSTSTIRTTSPTPRPAARKAFRVNSLSEFEAAFRAALASGKPTLIDASITRLAIPHYSTNPAGLLAAIEEAVEKKLEGG